jgi:hypothetical protein
MADANRTLLVETLGRRIHFSVEAGGMTFQHSGIVVAWVCPAMQYAEELGYSLCVRDDKTGQDDFWYFHEIRLIGKPTDVG